MHFSHFLFLFASLAILISASNLKDKGDEEGEGSNIRKRKLTTKKTPVNLKSTFVTLKDNETSEGVDLHQSSSSSDSGEDKYSKGDEEKDDKSEGTIKKGTGLKSNKLVPRSRKFGRFCPSARTAKILGLAAVGTAVVVTTAYYCCPEFVGGVLDTAFNGCKDALFYCTGKVCDNFGNYIKYCPIVNK